MNTYQTYLRLKRKPKGRWVFSFGYARRVPYFRSIRPRVRGMRPHRAEVFVPKRRAVLNHIGTVHAIAVCNGLEAAMGLLAEATVPPRHRWLPRSMQVDYVDKATTSVVCIAETTESDWQDLPDVRVRVSARRDDGKIVARGTITLWVTAKP